ncbi:MAG TPA: sigma-70 family RNA polymerase sigma factor [Steroidobacteraceae bacterium]|nr:sigma-70 family RNA polymerase sigma factor [Steroidobacteraceae bacterium]
MSTDPTFDGPDDAGPKEEDQRSETAEQAKRWLPVGPEHSQRVREVFEEEHDRLVHILVAKTGSWATARDIADEAFANVLEIAQRGSIGNVKAYVYKSALNRVGKVAKAAAYRRSVEHLVDEPSGEHTAPPETAIQYAGRLQKLQEALQALPARVRMAVVWRFWDEMPYEDIAARLGRHGIPVHERTVKRWIVNALEFCRQRIAGSEAGTRTDYEPGPIEWAEKP